MGVELESPKEFKAVMDQVFSLISEDPDMGPKLRDADVPQRFDFDDVDMVVNSARRRTARPATCTGSGATTSTGSRRSR